MFKSPHFPKRKAPRVTQISTDKPQKAISVRIRANPWRKGFNLCPDGLDALFEYIDSDICFFLRHNQRRANPHGARTASEEQDSVLKRHLNDAIALRSSVFLRRLILHDVDAN